MAVRHVLPDPTPHSQPYARAGRTLASHSALPTQPPAGRGAAPPPPPPPSPLLRPAPGTLAPTQPRAPGCVICRALEPYPPPTHAMSGWGCPRPAPHRARRRPVTSHCHGGVSSAAVPRRRLFAGGPCLAPRPRPRSRAACTGLLPTQLYAACSLPPQLSGQAVVPRSSPNRWRSTPPPVARPRFFTVAQPLLSKPQPAAPAAPLSASSAARRDAPMPMPVPRKARLLLSAAPRKTGRGRSRSVALNLKMPVCKTAGPLVTSLSCVCIQTQQLTGCAAQPAPAPAGRRAERGAARRRRRLPRSGLWAPAPAALRHRQAPPCSVLQVAPAPPHGGGAGGVGGRGQGGPRVSSLQHLLDQRADQLVVRAPRCLGLHRLHHLAHVLDGLRARLLGGDTARVGRAEARVQEWSGPERCARASSTFHPEPGVNLPGTGPGLCTQRPQRPLPRPPPRRRCLGAPPRTAAPAGKTRAAPAQPAPWQPGRRGHLADAGAGGGGARMMCDQGRRCAT
jgi:hypothetical protein